MRDLQGSSILTTGERRECDAACHRQIQRIAFGTNWNAHAVIGGLLDQRREAGALRSDQQREPFGPHSGEAGEWNCRLSRTQRDERKTSFSKHRQILGPVVEGRKWYGEGRSHRSANRLSIERIAAARREEDAAGAERGRISKHAAHVVGVRYLLEHHE